jgi:release factor glutamine methyltransferase
MPEQKTWNIIELLKVTEALLKEKNIDNARLNAELLLADTLKTDRINLYLDFEKPLNEKELTELRDKVRRRLSHEPIQYIIGNCEFYGLKFMVNPGVLIPRQETELLVDKCIDLIKSHGSSIPKILEIGTGSGCISISIVKNIDCMIDAIDINETSINTAEKNSVANGTQDRITFTAKNFFNDVNNFDGYDIVLSNPPYIPIEEYNSLSEEIINFEPKHALTDDKDGLSFYKKIIDIMKETKNPVKVLLEIGDGKKQIVKELLDKNSITKYSFFKDLINIDRVLYIEHSP